MLLLFVLSFCGGFEAFICRVDAFLVAFSANGRFIVQDCSLPKLAVNALCTWAESQT